MTDLPERALGQIESEISRLQDDLAGNWQELNAWRKRLVAEQSDLAVRKQDLDNKEKLLSQMAEDLERRAAEIAVHNERLKQQQLDVDDDKLMLDHGAASSARRESTLESRIAELGRLARELEVREREIESFAVDFEGKREELQSLRDAVERDRNYAERDREMARKLQKDLEDHAARMVTRESELRRAEDEIHRRLRSMEQAESQLGDRGRTISERQLELERYREELDRRWQALCKNEQAVTDREQALNAFGSLMQTQMPDTWPNATLHGPPPVPELPEPSVDDSRASLQATVDALERETRALMAELDATREQRGSDCGSASDAAGEQSDDQRGDEIDSCAGEGEAGQSDAASEL